MPSWASKASVCPVPYRQSVNLTTYRFSGSRSLSDLEPPELVSRSEGTGQVSS